jgi:hypothetical protein
MLADLLSHFKTFDTRFYISSCGASAKPLLQASRKHWGVENYLLNKSR